VDCKHPSAEAAGGLDRFGNNRWNVVILEVEEDSVTALNKDRYQRRALAGEKPASDFETAYHAAQLVA
jgi:hypothetical protein